jgi:hypothetical protein
MLVREFLQSLPLEGYSNSYGRGVLEMAVGIINDDDRFIGMYEFALWHHELLRKEGHLDQTDEAPVPGAEVPGAVDPDGSGPSE